MNDSADINETVELDPRDAAVIMAEAGERARRQLTISHPVIFASWGLVYLVGYGAIWLTVRGEHPYVRPAGWALGLLVALVVLALAVTSSVVERAAGGVGGLSSTQRRIYYLTLAIGWVSSLVMEAALDHAGASKGVIGVFAAAAPILVAGVVVMAASAVRANWAMFILGGWLIATAALAGFAGPAGAWGIIALAVGVMFLGQAAVRAVRRPA